MRPSLGIRSRRRVRGFHRAARRLSGRCPIEAVGAFAGSTRRRALEEIRFRGSVQRVNSEHVVAWGVSSSPDRCSFCGAQKTEERRLIASHDGAAVVCEDCVARFVDVFGRWDERKPRTPAHSSELSRRYRDRGIASKPKRR